LAPDHFSLSLQSPGPASKNQPITGTITHALPQPEADRDNVHGAGLTPLSPQTAKRKDRLDDSNSSSPPLPKKRKEDKPAPAMKKQNAKKSAKSGETMAAGASGASTSRSTAPAAVAKGNAKPPPAPRERSQRYDL